MEKRRRGQLLGGTHLSLVTKRLHEKYLHNPHFARTMCKIYVGISDKQAVYLNSNACITILFVQRMHMRGCASMHQRVPYGKTQDFNGSEPEIRVFLQERMRNR